MPGFLGQTSNGLPFTENASRATQNSPQKYCQSREVERHPGILRTTQNSLPETRNFYISWLIFKCHMNFMLVSITLLDAYAEVGFTRKKIPEQSPRPF